MQHNIHGRPYMASQYMSIYDLQSVVYKEKSMGLESR
jgi:hypothetical protein